MDAAGMPPRLASMKGWVHALFFLHSQARARACYIQEWVPGCAIFAPKHVPV